MTNSPHFEDTRLGFIASCVMFGGAVIFLGLMGWCGGML
jgi:hypothetical protein